MAMVVPSTAGWRAPLLPRRQKAARALHRAASEATADYAVPPLFYQSANPQKVASKRSNIGTPDAAALSCPEGWPCRHPAAKLTALLHSGAIASRRSGQNTAEGRPTMPIVTWDHVHLRSPDPEATAAWLEDILGGVIIRGPGRIDVKLGGANVFIAPVAAGDGVNGPPATPYQGLDHFGLTVKDIDAVAAEIRAKGVEFTRQPTTIRPGVRICFIRGPQGISIELLERDKKYA
jgi:catechol 2,3-dioxygenase-like lactoylglutathione lyase family enzyme